DGRPRDDCGRAAPGRRPGDGGGRPRSADLVTLRVEPATRRHLLADCWQTTLRAEGEDALCLVELRGFEPLTPCMPWTACPRERGGGGPSPLVRARAQLSAGHRCCPLLSPAPCPRHAPSADRRHCETAASGSIWSRTPPPPPSPWPTSYPRPRAHLSWSELYWVPGPSRRCLNCVPYAG